MACRGNVPAPRGEGKAGKKSGGDRSGYFYTFHRLSRNPGPSTQEPMWQSRS
jgi:hypothetical protein